jgi:integrase
MKTSILTPANKSRRRGSGEGTIRLRKKGGYEARLTLEDGSRRSIYGQSYEEVRRKLAAAIRDRDDGALMLGDARQTVGKYLMSWLQITKPTVEGSTYESYEGRVRRHIIPAFGRVRLKDLTPHHVQHLMATMLANGLAPNTVRNARATLRRALSEAMVMGVATRNVAALTRKPKVPRAEMHVYDTTQVRQLLESAAQTRHEALLTLAVTTGARFGELLSLAWRNVSYPVASYRCSSISAFGTPPTLLDNRSSCLYLRLNR